MLIDDNRVWNSVRKLVSRITADWALQQDLTQECVIRLWRLEGEQPGRTSSWYLQNCHFHLRHLVTLGRSVDSLKRGNGSNRITIDGTGDQPDLGWYHTNGEVLEMVSARDIVSTLTRHLTPCESAVLRGLADGLNLREIALQLKLSYPTALKRRRRIAALTAKLGFCNPSRRRMGSTDSAMHLSRRAGCSAH
jgi:DNA-directed RNA polymerase specialized sigma24 family protein